MTFNNSILSGETLVRAAMQSEGFVAGSSGWQIKRDGNAEFNSITVRGVLIVAFGGRSVEVIPYNPGGGTTPAITFNNGSTIEASILFNTTWGGLETFASPGGSGRIIQIHEDTQWSLYSTVTDQAISFHDGPGYLKASKVNGAGTAVVMEDWKTVVGDNGYTGGKYKLYPDGDVMLDGQFAGGTGASPIIVGSLPSGYRPRAYTEFMCARGGAFGVNKLTIDTAGIITQWSPDATYNTYVSGVRFSTLTT